MSDDRTLLEAIVNWAPMLEGRHLRCWLFVIRCAKRANATGARIALAEFANGRRGVRGDVGCGVRSELHIRRALKELEALGLIKRHRSSRKSIADYYELAQFVQSRYSRSVPTQSVGPSTSKLVPVTQDVGLVPRNEPTTLRRSAWSHDEAEPLQGLSRRNPGAKRTFHSARTEVARGDYARGDNDGVGDS